MASWRHIPSQIWVNISSDNGVLLNATNPWTSVDLSSVKSSNNNLRATSQEIPHPSIIEFGFKIMYLKFRSNQIWQESMSEIDDLWKICESPCITIWYHNTLVYYDRLSASKTVLLGLDSIQDDHFRSLVWFLGGPSNGYLISYTAVWGQIVLAWPQVFSNNLSNYLVITCLIWQFNMWHFFLYKSTASIKHKAETSKLTYFAMCLIKEQNP